MSWSPWAELARRPDILLHRCRLAEGAGWWCPAERVILLDDRLDRRAARCVLAHELAHVALGHDGYPEVADAGRLAVRAEGAADAWAARRLVAAEALAAALAAHPDDTEAVALQLDVTPDVVRRRLGDVDARAAVSRRSDRFWPVA